MGWVVNATLRPLYPQEELGTHCIRGWVGPRTVTEGCGKSRPSPGFDPRSVQPLASRYTDWAVPAYVWVVWLSIIHIPAVLNFVPYNGILQRRMNCARWEVTGWEYVKNNGDSLNCCPGLHIQELRGSHCVATTPPSPLQPCPDFNHIIYWRHSEVMCFASPKLLLNCYLFQTSFASPIIKKKKL